MSKSSPASAYTVTRSYDGKSADARRKQRRHQLIESCIKLIGSDGYANVSLNAICADAGLTKRYFYESFDSVDSLFTAAFRRITKELQQQVIEQISGQKTPQAMITAGFHAFFNYIQKNPHRGRVYLVESLGVNSLRAEMHGSGGGDISKFLLATTLQFLDDDKLPRPVLAVLAQGAIGAAIFIGQNWIASDYAQSIDELVQGVSEICFGISARLEIPLANELTQPQLIASKD